jgi:uncharacterized alpha-E superfamily protein
MLSRVAERTYWLARYLERAENSARMINVYSALLLDLPKSAEVSWEIVLDITNNRERFADLNVSLSEENILSFMLEDEDNPDALLSSLNHARENARTTRDIVPTEAWRAVNELCLYARKQLPKASRPRQRAVIMSTIVEKVHSITGMLAGTMSQGQPYQFIRMGRNLERADMTTRIIDVAAATLMTDRSGLERYDNTLWMAVLRCLSAYQMYRQYVRRRVQAADVMQFLLQDYAFPRSIAHCLAQVTDSLDQLPHAAATIDTANGIIAQLQKVESDNLSAESIHQVVDELQIGIGKVHNSINETWFYPVDLQ